MKSFNVVVWTYAPYKREFTYRENTTGLATAIRRAVAKFRKEDGIARKRIKQVSLSASW